MVRQNREFGVGAVPRRLYALLLSVSHVIVRSFRRAMKKYLTLPQLIPDSACLRKGNRQQTLFAPIDFLTQRRNPTAFFDSIMALRGREELCRFNTDW
ncbi:hypothetical protein VTI28DRAFT_10412 [Corynascus sepedonium]